MVRPPVVVRERAAVVDGLGIGLLPSFQIRAAVASGQVVRVLERWSREPAAVHAVFTGTRFLAPKVRAFVDEAVAGFAELVSEPKPRKGAASPPRRR